MPDEGSRHWLLLKGVSMALLAAALTSCGGQEAHTPHATVPTRASMDTSSGRPKSVTPVYVQGVLDALEDIDGTATREIIAANALVPDATYRLRAVYADPAFGFQTNTWAKQISDGLSGYRPQPGNIKDHVVQVLDGSPTCVFVSAQRDFSAVSLTPPPPHLSYFQLVPLVADDDPRKLNNTGWMIESEGYNSQGLTPADPCGTSASQ